MKQQRRPPAWFYLIVAAGMLIAVFVLAWIIGADGLGEAASGQ